jgi:hypothetical protein
MPTLTLRFAISEEGFTQDKEWSQPCCRTNDDGTRLRRSWRA